MTDLLHHDLRDNPLRCRVYRNLRKECWSIQVKVDKVWKVVAHATWANVEDAGFVVSQAGRHRVLRDRRKNVHAWVCGMLTGWGAEPANSVYVDNQAQKRGACQVSYNPYASPSFEALLPDETGELIAAVAVHKASKALLGKRLWMPLKDAQEAARADSDAVSPPPDEV